MKFSQGTLFILQPAGASGEGTTALTAAAGAPKRPTGAKAAAAPGATAGPAGMSAQGQRWGDGPVARAFEAFTRREPDIAEQINAMMQQEVSGSEVKSSSWITRLDAWSALPQDAETVTVSVLGDHFTSNVLPPWLGGFVHLAWHARQLTFCWSCSRAWFAA